MSKKQTIALLCGGVSPEHEVSINSARNIYKAINKRKYNVEIIGIGGNGAWRHIPVDILKKTERLSGNEGKALVLTPGRTNVIGYQSGKKDFPKIDAVFNIIHGPFGEDGTMQGLLSVLGLPFVGPDTLGAAVGMDKAFTKRILQQAGVLVAPWVTVFQHEKIKYRAIGKQLGYPVFVKPANMGSSVGVSKADNEKELKKAVKEAFKFDHKILIEQGLIGREIETAVLGNIEQIEVAGIGEIIMEKGFYDYESKYISANAAKVVVPAKKVSKKATKLIRKTAAKAYKALGLEGLARMDVFLVDGEKVYVNEPNTLPGFTNISMYPKLWEAADLPYSKLIDRLIQLAIERHKRNNSLQRTRL